MVGFNVWNVFVWTFEGVNKIEKNVQETNVILMYIENVEFILMYTVYTGPCWRIWTHKI